MSDLKIPVILDPLAWSSSNRLAILGPNPCEKGHFSSFSARDHPIHSEFSASSWISRTQRAVNYCKGEQFVPIAAGGQMTDHTSKEPDPSHDPSEDTAHLNTEPFLGERAQPDNSPEETLFETYDRRSLRSIIAQQQAYRDSQAAQAARAILHGAEIPEYSDQTVDSILIEEYEETSDGRSPERVRYRKIRVQRVSAMGHLASPGAQIVYVLLVVAALGGTLGLAFSTDSPHLLLIAGIATPMLLPICVWRWLCWLDSSPYYYRLLTTLGEDARNLLQYRLLWKKSAR